MIGIQNKKPDDNDEKKDDVKDVDELKSTKESTFNSKKMIVIGAVVLVVVVIIASIISGGSDESNTQQTPAKSIVTPNPSAEIDGDGTVSGTSDGSKTDLDKNSDSFVQGDPQYSADGDKTSAKVYSADDYIKDLQGADVPAIFSVNSMDYIKTHVSYVAKRAIIDDGMEMYWLDVTYKKKKYRMQVPYYYFKSLEDEGICRVEIEVLNLEGGGQIISDMQIISEDDGE